MAFWYCKAGEKEVGPYSAKQLKALAEAGKISRQTPIRENTDGAEWGTAGELSGVFPPMAKAIPLVEPTAAPTPVRAVAVATPVAAAPQRGVAVVASAPQRGTAVAPAITPHDTARVPVAPTVAMGVVVTPAAGSPVVRGVTPVKPNKEEEENPTAKHLAMGAIGVGVVGLVACMVPFVAIALGAVGTIAGVVCFLLPGAGKQAHMLAIGGALASLAAIGAGGFMFSQQRAAAELAKEKADKEAAEQPDDKQVDEAALDAAAARKAKAKADAEKANTPVATAGAEKSPNAPVGANPAVKGSDAQRKFLSTIKRYGKAPSTTVQVSDRKVKVIAAWYTSNATNPIEGAGSPAAPAPTPEAEGAAPTGAAPVPDVTSEAEAPAEPAAEGSAEMPPLAAPVLKAAEGDAKYICIEVQITNSGKEAAWNFASWDASMEKGANPALLVDSAGNATFPVGIVALDGSGKPERSLKPGEMVSVGLVFAAPADRAGALKLALASGGIGVKSNVGFEISPQVLAAGRVQPKPMVAAQAPMPGPEGEGEGELPPLKIDTPPAEPAPEAPAAVPEGEKKPEAMEEEMPPDIRKQIEEAAKKDREKAAAEGKGEPKPDAPKK